MLSFPEVRVWLWSQSSVLQQFQESDRCGLGRVGVPGRIGEAQGVLESGL